jgi:ketosteroid isomerase-like protein
LLSNAWSLTGAGPDGKPLTMGATTAGVVRRQADGTWR